VALAVAISPSSGMSETTPPHAGSPAPEISAAEALRKGNEAYLRKDYPEAMRWLRRAADQGNATA
jgi:TPR repeat protein